MLVYDLITNTFISFHMWILNIHWKYSMWGHRAIRTFPHWFHELSSKKLNCRRSGNFKINCLQNHPFEECTKCAEWTDRMKPISSILSSLCTSDQNGEELWRVSQRRHPCFFAGSKESLLRSALDKKQQGVLGTT